MQSQLDLARFEATFLPADLPTIDQRLANLPPRQVRLRPGMTIMLIAICTYGYLNIPMLIGFCNTGGRNHYPVIVCTPYRISAFRTCTPTKNGTAQWHYCTLFQGQHRSFLICSAVCFFPSSVDHEGRTSMMMKEENPATVS